MVSEKQLEANRRNAQLSTGPKSQEGKDRVRLNALTHGLRTEVIDVLPNEDPEVFAASLDAWEFDLKPTGEAQAHLVRQIALDSWKIARLDRYETAVVSRNIIDAINACDCDDDDSKALVEAAALASFDPSNEGERLRRYQFALRRGMLRSLDVLAKMKREEERTRAVGANEANSITPNKPISEDVRQECRTHKTPEPVPVPNKPIPENVRQECRTHEAAPNKPISPSSPAPNKPISARPSQFSSGSVGKGPQPQKHEIWPIDLDLLSPDAGAKGWLNVSCVKS